MKPVLSVVALVALLAYAGFVAHRNSIPVDIDLVFTAAKGVPLWLALLVAAVFGAVLTGLACSWPVLQLRFHLRRQRRQIRRLEQEIHGLRTLHLEEEPQPMDASAREG